MLLIVIPTIPGREETLQRTLDSYHKHTFRDYHFSIYKNPSSAGEGWKAGVEQYDWTTPDYVHLTNDDCVVTDPKWFDVCAESVDEGKLPCPVVRRPDGSIESAGGDTNAPAHLLSEECPDNTVVDFTTIPFMSWKQWTEIGMLPIHYGSDVWVSHRGRQLGYETVVRTHYAITHYRSDIGRLSAHAGETQILREALDGA